MAIVFHDPVMDLPREYYTAIGEFMFRFAQLEYQMHEIVWAAFDMHLKQGRILTIGTDIRVLCGMVSTITSVDTWVKSRTRIQEMNFLAKRAREHATFRNQLAHGSWQSIGGDPSKAVLHFMKEASDRIMPRAKSSLDARAIAKKAGELSALNHRARKLIAILQSERPSLPRRSP